MDYIEVLLLIQKNYTEGKLKQAIIQYQNTTITVNVDFSATKYFEILTINDKLEINTEDIYFKLPLSEIEDIKLFNITENNNEDIFAEIKMNSNAKMNNLVEIRG